MTETMHDDYHTSTARELRMGGDEPYRVDLIEEGVVLATARGTAADCAEYNRLVEVSADAEERKLDARAAFKAAEQDEQAAEAAATAAFDRLRDVLCARATAMLVPIAATV